MEDSPKKKNEIRIGGSFFGCLERLLSPRCMMPRCHKRLLIRRLEIALRK